MTEIRKSPSGALVQVSGESVIYRPGGANEGSFVNSWDAVEDAIRGAAGFITVYFDKSIEAVHIPSTANIDCQGRTRFVGAVSNDSTTVTIDDGAVIRNLASVENRIILTSSPTTPPLVYDGIGVLSVIDAQIQTTGATGVLVDIEDGGRIIVELSNGGILGDGSGAVINLEDNALAVVEVLSTSSVNGDSVSGTAASGLQILGDDTGNGFLSQTFSGMAGTIQRVRLSNANLATPDSGVTGNRPTGDNVTTGQMFFDTTLGQPVWWDGAQWVDATGAPA